MKYLFSLSAILLVFLCCKGGGSKSNNQLEELSEKDILDVLDSCCYPLHPYVMYPDLGHGYNALANSRITLFKKNSEWAVVYEVLGYNARNGNFDITLYYFGNCLINLDKQGKHNSNMKYITLANWDQLSKFIDNSSNLYRADSLKIRDQVLFVPNDIMIYKAANVQDTSNIISAETVLRFLSEKHKSLFCSTTDELKKCLPESIEKIYIINNWHHDEYDCYTGSGQGIKPSKQEVNQLIAKVLVTGDTSLYRPTLKPNNDWRNWKDSGGL